MTSPAPPVSDARGMGSIPALLARRWPILAAVALSAAGVAFAVSSGTDTTYEARAKVLVARSNAATVVTGTSDSTYQDPVRFIQTEVTLARLPRIRDVAFRAPVEKGIPADDSASLSVSAGQNTDVLAFAAQSTNKDFAREAAAAAAAEYVRYRTELDTRSVLTAKSRLDRRLRDLRGAGEQGSALYADLSAKAEALDTAATLGSARASLVDSPTQAEAVAPRPLVTGILGLLLGTVLGSVLLVAFDRLDRRVRADDEFEGALGAQIIGRLADPRDRPKQAGLVSIVAPESAATEAIRTLRTNLEFIRAASGVRTILVTSAVAAEGKSTTACNLAVLEALRGRDVVLVDLDLRRPSVHTYFDIPASPGLADVVTGQADLDDALVDLPVTRRAEGAAAISRSQSGRLRILTAGHRVPSPGEFVVSDLLAELVERLAAEADLVLIDTPPALVANDALALSNCVDGCVVVLRATDTDRRTLGRLAEALTPGKARTLGLVLTAALSRQRGYGRKGDYYYQADDVPPQAGQRRPLRARASTRV